MGTLTLAELTEEVRSHLGGRDDLDDRITRFINFAQLRLARAYTFPELHRRSYTTGTYGGTALSDRFITLPANVRSVQSVVVEDGSTSIKLTYHAPRRFDRLFSGLLSTGRRKPQVYTKWLETIELMPVPEKAYQYELRWVKWPDNLVESTDKSELDRKDELLILLAASIANHSLARFDRGKMLYGMFAASLEQVIKDEEIEPDEEIKPIFEHDGQAQTYWTNPFVKGV